MAAKMIEQIAKQAGDAVSGVSERVRSEFDIGDQFIDAPSSSFGASWSGSTGDRPLVPVPAFTIAASFAVHP